MIILEVKEAPSCPDPTGLTASNVTSTSADLAWTAGGTFETVWNVEYGLTGFTLGSGTLTSTTTPSYSMSGLMIILVMMYMYRRIVEVGM